MSGKYQAYPEYKDSGVAGISTLPAHWAEVPLKHVATCNDEVLPENTDPDFEFHYIDISSVSKTEGVTRTEKLKFSVAPSRARRVVKSGDVIVSTVRTYLEAIAPISHQHEGMVASTGFAVIRPTRLESTFAQYALRAQHFIDEVVARSTGVSYPAINASDLVCISTPVPPIQEQRTIAAFLDHETARIDRLIEKQQRLIELLKEKRQAVISHAVTKGLDPNVPMKDSGVEWLGQVPEHWGVLKIRYVTKKVTTGGTPTDKDAFVESEGVCWFTPGDFKENIELKQANKKVSYDSVSTGDAKLYPKNSVVMVGIGATLGKVGFITHQFSANQQINILVPNNNTSALFLSYAISAQFEQIRLAANASTLGIINQDKTKQIIIAVPPYDEQLFIQGYLSSFDLQTGKALDKSTLQISLLQERRTALISAAVTGKIDVRNWATPTW